MNKFLIEIWYRYGQNEDKDFEQIEIDADSEEEAHAIARDLRSWIYKVETIKINDEEIKKQ